MQDPFNHTIVILNKDIELHLPLTDYQYNQILEQTKDALFTNTYIFLSEEQFNQALEDAINSRLY